MAEITNAGEAAEVRGLAAGADGRPREDRASSALVSRGAGSDPGGGAAGRTSGRGAPAAAPVESGCGVYDRAGGRLGLVEEVRAGGGTFSIRQAGLGLGVLGGELVVPRRLVAGRCSGGIALDATSTELAVYRVRP